MKNHLLSKAHKIVVEKLTNCVDIRKNISKNMTYNELAKNSTINFLRTVQCETEWCLPSRFHTAINALITLK